MDLRILDVSLVRSGQFSEPIVRYQSFCHLLRQSLDAAQRLRDAAAVKAVEVGFLLALHLDIWVRLVGLLYCEAVLKPVVVERLVGELLHFFLFYYQALVFDGVLGFWGFGEIGRASCRERV